MIFLTALEKDDEVAAGRMEQMSIDLFNYIAATLAVFAAYWSFFVCFSNIRLFSPPRAAKSADRFRASRFFLQLLSRGREK